MLFPFQWQDIPNGKGCANWCWMLMEQFWKWCLIWFWTAKIYGNEENEKSIAIYIMMWGQGGLRTTILVTETVNRPFALLLNRIFSLFPNTSSLLLVSFLFPLNTNYQPNFVEQVNRCQVLHLCHSCWTWALWNYKHSLRIATNIGEYMVDYIWAMSG